jgi:O-antigen ligase
LALVEGVQRGFRRGPRRESEASEETANGRRRSRSARSIILGPLAWPIGLVVVTAVVSVFFSLARDSSLHELRGQLFKFVLVYVAVLNIARDGKDWRRRAYWSIFVAGVAAAAYGIVAYYTNAGVDVGRALGPAKSYTRSAMYFILWTPLALAGLFYGGISTWRVRALIVAGIVPAWWFVVLTQTRGAMAVILLSIVTLAGLKRWKWTALLLVICLLVAIGVPSFRGRCLTTVRDLSHPNALLSERLTLWKIAARVISDHPLVGIGYGSEIFQQETVRKKYPMYNYKYQPHAHNFYLQTACEAGVLHLAGLLAFFLGFLAIAGRGLRNWPADAAGTDRAIVIGAFTGVAAMAVYGMVGHFHERRVAMMMWYLIALGCAAIFEAQRGPWAERKP